MLNGLHIQYYKYRHEQEEINLQPALYTLPNSYYQLFGDEYLRLKVTSELLSEKESYEYQALIMIYQAWQAYEGLDPNMRWGANRGSPTKDISAFQIAMGVFAENINRKDWREDTPGPGMAKRWVDLIPTAASYLALTITEGIDYLAYSQADLPHVP